MVFFDETCKQLTLSSVSVFSAFIDLMLHRFAAARVLCFAEDISCAPLKHTLKLTKISAKNPDSEPYESESLVNLSIMAHNLHHLDILEVANDNDGGENVKIN